MWQRFTERARRIILLAQEEAGKMQSPHVGSEHLLLGLVRENEGVAAQILSKMGVHLDAVRAAVVAEAISDEPASNFRPEPKFTPEARRILELAKDEARQMRHNYIGTEHLLLALLREKEGLAARVLHEMGLDLEGTRDEVLKYLGPDAAQPSPQRHSPAGAEAAAATPASEAERHQSEDAALILVEMLHQMQEHEARNRAYDRMLMRLLRRMLTQSEAATTLLADCGLDIEAAKAKVQLFLEETEQ